MSDWWTTTPVPQSTEDVAARNRAMVEEIQRLMEPATTDPTPVARPGDPPRCACRVCPRYDTTRCNGRCSDCGSSTCAQCRRNYPQDVCGDCGGDGCTECCSHDIESCCGWCDVCESHPGNSREDVCDKGHCHSCDHECSDP